MTYDIRIADEKDVPSMHAILMICGEHMHRTQNLHHWYPYRPIERYRTETQSATIYAVYEGDLLVGTFYLSREPRPWYDLNQWENPAHSARYLGGVGVLPFMQGRGIGKWIMGEVERIARAECDALRFDGVSFNEPLLRFYDKLGYTRRGLCQVPNGNAVMCFEKVFLST